MGAISGSGLSLGTLFISIEANLKEAEKALAKFGDETSKLIKDQEKKWAGLAKVGDSFKDVGSKLTLGLTAPLAAAAIAATKFSTDLNAAMANVASLIPGNTARVQELKTSVQDLAIATGKSTGDIAGGLYQVISAFGDTAETVKILDINARAAAAGVATTKDAIDLTSAVTKAYGDTTATAVQHTSDLALTAVKLGQTTFPELASSIGRVTPLAKELGVSQEELFATMATGSGVTGDAAEVSTQFRGVLQGLLAPTKEMATLYDVLGVSSGKALIEQKGLSGAIQTVLEASKATDTPLQKFIGSIEGQTLALSLVGPQADSYNQKLKAMHQASGATAEAFKEQTSGINATGFALNQFVQKATVVAQRLGDSLGPALSRVLDAMQPLLGAVESAIKWFADLPQPVQTTAFAIAGLAAAIGPISGLIGNLLKVIGPLTSGVKLLAGALGTAAGSSGAMGDALASLKGAALLTAGAFAGFKLGQWAYDQIPGFKAMGDAMADVIGRIPGVQTVIERLSGATAAQKAAADGLAFSTQKLEQSLAKKGITVDKTGKTTEQYAEALRDAAREAGLFKKTQADVNQELEKEKKQILESRKQTQLHEKAMKELGLALDDTSKKRAKHTKATEADTEAAMNLRAEIEANEKAGKLWFKQMQDQLDAIEALKKKSDEFKQALSDIPLVETSAKIREANQNFLLTAESIEKTTADLERLLGPIQAIKGPIGELSDGLHQLGITSSANFRIMADEAKAAYEKIKDSGKATIYELEQARIKWLEAERAAAQANAGIWTEANEKELTGLKKKYEDFGKTQKNAWTDLTNEVSTIVTNFAQDISKSLWEGEGSWGEKGIKVLKQLGEAVTSFFITPAVKAITGFITGAIADLLGGKGLGGVLDRIKDIGTALADVFKDAPQVPTAAPAPGAPPPGVPGVGGVVGGALSGWIGAIGSAVSAISGVISNFQLAGVNKSLDVIVNHTLRIFNELFQFRADEWSRWGGWMLIKDDILSRMNTLMDNSNLGILKFDDMIGALNSIMDSAAAASHTLNDILEFGYISHSEKQTWFDRLIAGVERVAIGTERSLTMNLYGTDATAVATKIAQQLRLQGATT